LLTTYVNISKPFQKPKPKTENPKTDRKPKPTPWPERDGYRRVEREGYRGASPWLITSSSPASSYSHGL